MTAHETALVEIRAALEPFAEAAKKYSPVNGWSKDDPLIDTCRVIDNILIGDLRRASRALAILSTLSPEPATPPAAKADDMVNSEQQAIIDGVLLDALEDAADFIKEQDAGDPSTDTGWKSEELLNHWISVQGAITRIRDIPRREAEAATVLKGAEEALKRVVHTLTVHGKIDADTPLHEFVDEALFRIRSRSQPAVKAPGG